MVKVTKNIYGNYRGLVTGKGWTQLGANEFDAIVWASDRLEQFPGERLSLVGDITLDQINKYRKSLA